MTSHPYYDAPDKDQGRDERVSDWNKSEIKDFLEERYDEPLEEFEAESYEELEEMIGELEYEEDADWRYDQVPELGEKNYESRSTFFPVKKEDIDKIENPQPAEEKFIDEDGEVQIKWNNR